MNVLDEVVKMINFIKSLPLSTDVFDILCEEMADAQSISSAYQNRKIVFRKSASAIMLWAELAAFFMKHKFYLKEQLTDHIQIGCLADHVLETNREPVRPGKTDNASWWWIKFELWSDN